MNKFVTYQNVEKVKGSEYFPNALYMPNLSIFVLTYCFVNSLRSPEQIHFVLNTSHVYLFATSTD